MRATEKSSIHEFRPIPSGSPKSVSAMPELMAKIKAGHKCSVATLDPEKTAADFKSATGSDLFLTTAGGCIYEAKLTSSVPSYKGGSNENN